MKIKPLYDRVLVKLIKEEIILASGIVLPTNDKEIPTKGEIIDIGDGKMLPNGKFAKLQVKIGDIVRFQKFSGFPLEDDFVIMREDELLGIIHN
jgi:chaperonin GroES